LGWQPGFVGGWRARETRTGSGVVAVQLVHESGGVVVEVEHVGCARDAIRLSDIARARPGPSPAACRRAELEPVTIRIARPRLSAVPEAENDSIAAASSRVRGSGRPGSRGAGYPTLTSSG
jgi:hypothetical protein